MKRDILLTGIPRSGTTLCCSLLNRLPDVLALVEPLDMSTLRAADSDEDRVRVISSYLAKVRLDVQTKGEAPRQILTGEGTNTFSSQPTGKRSTAIIGSETVKLASAFSDGFTLVIKHPNLFVALLPVISRQFECFAMVRNPLAILASWNSLDHPLADGHAPMAEAFDNDLRLRLNEITNSSKRQVSLLDWYFSRFLEVLEPRRLLRYEDLIATQGRSLAVIVQAAHGLPNLVAKGLESRNNNVLYSTPQSISRSADLLLADQTHSCWHLYGRQDVVKLQEALLTKQHVDD